MTEVTTVSIVGLQRSGTNYLQSLVADYFGEQAIGDFFWKHSLPSEIDPIGAGSGPVMLIVRHPAMWLESCLTSHASELIEARTAYLDRDTPSLGYAKLYNEFNREWLRQISRSAGVLVRYEDLLRGDFGAIAQIAIATAGKRGSAARMARPPGHMPNSLAFSAEDRQRNINIECGLPPAVIDRFWKALDPELVGQLGYDHGQIRTTGTPNWRAIAYRFVREPGAIDDAAFLELKRRAGGPSAQSASLLYSIGLREISSGHPREALAWFDRALRACDQEVLEHGSRSGVITTRIYVIASILDLRRFLEGASEALEYEREYRAHLEHAARFFLETVEADERRQAPPVVRADNLSSLSLALTRLGRLDAAIACARKSVELAPLADRHHGQLALALAKDGRVRCAGDAFRQAIALAPENAGYRFGLSDVLERQGRVEEALAEAERAMEGAAQPPWRYNHLGGLLARVGRLEEAEQALVHALRLDPGDARHHVALSDVLARQERLGEALGEAAIAVGLANEDPWSLNHYGWLLAGAGRLDEAERNLREAVRLEPADARHRFALSDVLRRQGRLQEALAEAARSVEAPNALAWHFLSLGRLLVAAGRLSEAQASLRIAVERDPGDWHGHFDLSLVLERRQRFEEALRSAKAAIAAGASEAEVFRHGAMLLARTGRFAEARTLLRRARRARPWKLRHDLAACARVLAQRSAWRLGRRRGPTQGEDEESSGAVSRGRR